MKAIKILAVNILIFVFLILFAEIGLRIFINYNPSYYTSIDKKGACVEYPYGLICYNSMGFPDDEFNLDSEKPKIGYFGDSVCAGVGAGQGYRVSDLLEDHFKNFEHWNYCSIAYGLTSKDRKFILKKIDDHGLSKIVYLMNLNDITTSIVDRKDTDAVRKVRFVNRFVHFLRLDWLRGKSYLYTYVRNIVKTYLTVKGHSYVGYMREEFFPIKNIGTMREFSKILKYFGQDLKVKGVEFIVVMLPYEMQISNDAAEKYKDLGIKWEDGFLQGSTQEFLMKELGYKENLTIYNAYDAFEGIKNHAKVGEYFVFNRGDKIDWNHPNRKGHKIISDFLINKNFLY